MASQRLKRQKILRLLIYKRKGKTQSISEYVIIVSLIASALVLMQTYMRRGIQSIITVQSMQASGGQYKVKLEYVDEMSYSDTLTNAKTHAEIQDVPTQYKRETTRRGVSEGSGVSYKTTYSFE